MASSPAPSDDSHDSGDDNENENETNQNDGSGNTKTPAVKDKECQYCHQKFTSSSLGRHLDQFLTKKKPDGVHNVDEIRRLRGGITRRTARSHQKKEAGEAVQAGAQSPSPQYTLPSYSELVNKTAVKEDVRFNRANWQATGVITDTTVSNPPVVTVASPATAEYPANIVAGQKRSYSTYATDASSAAASETLRALELSLQEVLDAMRVATKKSAPLPQPFEFEFESQTFPYLCLALLPTPPTLFQSTPFATPISVPLSPPGSDQYQTLRNAAMNKIDSWKWDTLAWVQKSNPPGMALAEQIDLVNEQVQTHTDSSLAHLDAAYQNFMSYGTETRHSIWTIELLRAYKMEQAKVKDAHSAATRLTQELNQLQQQLDHLSRCQWPREMALWPPERPTFDSTTQDELRKINVLRGIGSSSAGNTPSNTHSDDADEQARNNDRWDYDRLISKWRRHVREDRARRTGVQPSVPLLQSGQPSGPPSFSDQALQSPKSYPSNTPRIASSLYKSTTIAGGTAADLLAGGRSASAGLAHSNTSLENSPRTIDGMGTAGLPFGPVNGIAPSTPGTAPPPPLPGPSGLGGSPAGIFGTIPPPPRSRPLGIISDVDEYYAPRLMGLRRDPPAK